MSRASTGSVFVVALLVTGVLASASPAEAGARRSAGVCVAGLITREQQAFRADGATVTTRYQERLVRDAEHLWIERVLHEGGGAGHEHRWTETKASGMHRHLDVSRFARLVTREGGEGVRLRLVSLSERLLVDVAPSEYEQVGFAGDVDEAWFLVPRALRASLNPTGKAEGQGKWLARKTPKGEIRVLWSEAHDLPLIVEARDARGRVIEKISVRVSSCSTAQPRPWSRLEGLTKKEYVDYLD